MEKLYFLLIPYGRDLEDSEEIVKKYYDMDHGGVEAQYWSKRFRSHVVYKRSYRTSDFKSDYHAFKGTLMDWCKQP